MHLNHRPACVAAFLIRKEREIYERFWGYVRKTDGCWLWTGPIDDFGYGRTRLGDASPRAHRFMYEMEHGPIPPGMVVMHTCDVPACVRLDHLRVGTIPQNNADRDAKGRGRIARKGEDNRMAKLTTRQVLEIRRRWTGEWGQGIAFCREYGIKAPALYGIVRGTTWKHLLPP